jgi:hypothetical protein
MDASLIEREYPYRHSLIALASGFLVSGAGTAVCLWKALTDDKDVILCIFPLQGFAAVLFRWVAFFVLGGLMFVSGRLLWKRINNPSQRIALTARGIFLPRYSWSVKEEFVEYRKIGKVRFEESSGYGYREVDFLHFDCPQGRFSIARGKLMRRDFVEICEVLPRKIKEATGFPDVPAEDSTA